MLIGADAISAHTHQQRLEGLDEDLASQHTLAQLGIQGSLRRLLGGSARQLAAADDEEDESYDDDLDIDEPLTAGQANRSLPPPRRFLHSRRIPFDSAPRLTLQVEKLTKAAEPSALTVDAGVSQKKSRARACGCIRRLTHARGIAGEV